MDQPMMSHTAFMELSNALLASRIVSLDIGANIVPAERVAMRHHHIAVHDCGGDDVSGATTIFGSWGLYPARSYYWSAIRESGSQRSFVSSKSVNRGLSPHPRSRCGTFPGGCNEVYSKR